MVVAGDLLGVQDVDDAIAVGVADGEGVAARPVEVDGAIGADGRHAKVVWGAEVAGAAERHERAGAPSVPSGRCEGPNRLPGVRIQGHDPVWNRLEDTQLEELRLLRVHGHRVRILSHGNDDDGPSAGLELAGGHRHVRLQVEVPLPHQAAIFGAVRADCALAAALQVERVVDQTAIPHDARSGRPIWEHPIGLFDRQHARHVLRVPVLLPICQGDAEDGPETIREDDVAIHNGVHLVGCHGILASGRLPHAVGPLQGPIAGAQGAHRVVEGNLSFEVTSRQHGAVDNSQGVGVIRGVLRNLVPPQLAACGRVDGEDRTVIADGVHAAAVQRHVAGVPRGGLELPAELATLVEGVDESCGALDVDVEVAVYHGRTVEDLHHGVPFPLLRPARLLEDPCGLAQVEGSRETREAGVVEVAPFVGPIGRLCLRLRDHQHCRRQVRRARKHQNRQGRHYGQFGMQV
mmetsp:Transcript_102362/g.319877  ORF Transcript_102362/g.319877 Transcript_102362/m.319877 type:complete len:462 (-) Transcript_102362:43-1428(-)